MKENVFLAVLLGGLASLHGEQDPPVPGRVSRNLDDGAQSGQTIRLRCKSTISFPTRSPPFPISHTFSFNAFYCLSLFFASYYYCSLVLDACLCLLLVFAIVLLLLYAFSRKVTEIHRKS